MPDPGEQRREHHEDGQPDGNDDQGAFGVMDDHLVDDGLGEQRRAEGEQLDEQGGGQDIAPDVLVLEQFRQEPAEAECSLAIRDIGIAERRSFLRQQQHRPEIMLAKRRGRQLQRRIGAGVETDHPFRGDIGQQGQGGFWKMSAILALGGILAANIGAVFRGCTKRQGRRGDVGEPVGAAMNQPDPEAKGAGGVDQGVGGIRRRKLPEQQFRIERNAVDRAKAAQRPDEMGGVELPADKRLPFPPHA